jgi:HJR/Mrr/RecB family endonuclease
MRLLNRREKYFISAIVTICTRTVWVFIYVAYQLFKLILDGLYGAIKWVYFYFKYRDTGMSYEQIINSVETVSPRQFEILCGNIFKANGYRIEVTSDGNDYGRDLIANNQIFIECKHYNEDGGGVIGRVALEKLIGSCMAFNIKHAIMINTGNYHPNAYEYADRINKQGQILLELWGKEELLRLINNIEPKKVYYTLHYLEG